MNLTNVIIEQTINWIESYLPSFYSGLSAFLISALMEFRAKRTKRHIITGALICGIFALTTSAMLAWLGLPANSGAFLGSLIGFVGADRISNIAVILIYRRTGSNDIDNKK